MMQIKLFSSQYKIHRLTDQNIDEIYHLLSKNVLYYEYCPPFVTRESIREDMKILPPGKEQKDKYYIGFYQDEKLIAVMDFIDGYPEKGIAYIGFFMTDTSLQNHSVRLAWVKGNPQSEHFWLKNGFVQLRETTSNAADEVILAEKMLEKNSGGIHMTEVQI